MVYEFCAPREWYLRGFVVKPGAEGILLPFIPRNTAKVHIKRVRCFTHDQVETFAESNSRGEVMPEEQKFGPHEPITCIIGYHSRGGRGRWERFMDGMSKRDIWRTANKMKKSGAGKFDNEYLSDKLGKYSGPQRKIYEAHVTGETIEQMLDRTAVERLKEAR